MYNIYTEYIYVFIFIYIFILYSVTGENISHIIYTKPIIHSVKHFCNFPVEIFLGKITSVTKRKL